jgi:hypothetical protein
MNLNCTIYRTTSDGQVPVCRIGLRDGLITGQLLDPKSGNLMRSILAEDPLNFGTINVPKSDPEAWMWGLPYFYSNDYVRADLQDAVGNRIDARGAFDYGGKLYRYRPATPASRHSDRAAEQTK